ncbi:uncharacterized protein LOC141726206 [Zonotrichia albicollis]|uniref:uncharacterized protein LOC141726206 n=1 Tax=Zonotrichia albicollis TaxID=44394 RepID=UPI003D80B211
MIGTRLRSRPIAARPLAGGRTEERTRRDGDTPGGHGKHRGDTAGGHGRHRQDSQLPPRRGILSVKTSRAAKQKLHFLKNCISCCGCRNAGGNERRQQRQHCPHQAPGFSKGWWDGNEDKKRRRKRRRKRRNRSRHLDFPKVGGMEMKTRRGGGRGGTAPGVNRDVPAPPSHRTPAAPTRFFHFLTQNWLSQLCPPQTAAHLRCHLRCHLCFQGCGPWPCSPAPVVAPELSRLSLLPQPGEQLGNSRIYRMRDPSSSSLLLLPPRAGAGNKRRKISGDGTALFASREWEQPGALSRGFGLEAVLFCPF